MAEKKKYSIKVQGKKIEVSRETYESYHRIERHRRTLEEKDARNGRMLYSSLDTNGKLGEEMLTDRSAPSVEDIVVSHLLYEHLHRCLELLPAAEYELLHAIFFENQSERQLAERTGVHYMTIHNRKVAILKKLKKFLGNEK